MVGHRGFEGDDGSGGIHGGEVGGEGDTAQQLGGLQHAGDVLLEGR